jgi:hypothetical protein
MLLKKLPVIKELLLNKNRMLKPRKKIIGEKIRMYLLD